MTGVFRVSAADTSATHGDTNPAPVTHPPAPAALVVLVSLVRSISGPFYLVPRFPGPQRPRHE